MKSTLILLFMVVGCGVQNPNSSSTESELQVDDGKPAPKIEEEVVESLPPSYNADSVDSKSENVQSENELENQEELSPDEALVLDVTMYKGYLAFAYIAGSNPCMASKAMFELKHEENLFTILKKEDPEKSDIICNFVFQETHGRIMWKIDDTIDLSEAKVKNFQTPNHIAPLPFVTPVIANEEGGDTPAEETDGSKGSTCNSRSHPDGSFL
ncbi:hypothetical protein [Pseudobacteriovorax antillogorgiicola]|uniref:Uncharacterized protein n=1 Tax=Pseudobacteriovorax antillogorgiicola TaxID=1513793 RepID=A0A1Y6CN84_9BACT|nr:hypothetical protein [Pseudobacteriovorax antillogorgiicola]TCS44622.1 hypothetical protein EDD56_13255 [Pseudobacteriovorax antillogorgiicola]SMF78380.1 hypothetical protein SAMN06296036_13255 [Pseudobacteriovorax antillogorgiicola]